MVYYYFFFNEFSLFSEFGYKVMPIKPVMKILPNLLENRDKNIREETKQLVIEIYRWIGNAIKPQMSHFKPVQVSHISYFI